MENPNRTDTVRNAANYFQKKRRDAANGTRGTEDLLYIYIDQHIFKEVKTNKENAALKGINKKKSYNKKSHGKL